MASSPRDGMDGTPLRRRGTGSPLTLVDDLGPAEWADCTLEMIHKYPSDPPLSFYFWNGCEIVADLFGLSQMVCRAKKIIFKCERMRSGANQNSVHKWKIPENRGPASKFEFFLLPPRCHSRMSPLALRVSFEHPAAQ